MQSTTNRKACPETHGTCHLTIAAGMTHDEALEGGSALLVLRPERGAWTEYWVRRIRLRGKVVGYRLEKFVGHPEEKAPVYDIDCQSDPWTCDCPDSCFNRGPGRGVCKHVSAIRAVLQRAGLLEEAAPVLAPAATVVAFDDP